MKEFGLFLAFLVVFTLAVKQAAFILLNGSVFQWLRDLIREQLEIYMDYEFDERFEIRAKYWFWSKAQELFTCNLCMTAQMSIWLCALPTTIMVHLSAGHPFEQLLQTNLHWSLEAIGFVFMAFVLAMAVASSAMAWWGLVEYLPTKLVAEKDFLRHRLEQEKLTSFANNDQLAALLANLGKSAKPQLDFETFLAIIKQMERKCDDIGCGIARRECRIDLLDETLENLAKEKGWQPSLTFKLKDLLTKFIKQYNEEKSRYYRKQHELEAYQHRLFELVLQKL